MTNKEMAAMLFNIATLLRDRSDNPYRIRAYENAARALMGRKEDAVSQLATAEKTLPHPKGVLGARLQRKLRELAKTGELTYFHELCADLPEHLESLMRVPGIGPRTADYLHEALGIETPEQLVAAARAHRLQPLWGFGPKRESQIAQLSLFDETLMGQRDYPEQMAA